MLIGTFPGGGLSEEDLNAHAQDTALHFGINPAANVDGTLYRGDTAPTGATRLNYSGYFEATRVYGSYYSDYAEFFNVIGEFAPGLAVEIAGENEFRVCQSDKSARAIGVISDEYYMCIGRSERLSNVPVALMGKVHCSVAGEVKPGDLLVTAGPGGKLRALAPGEDAPMGAVLGQALTSARDGQALMLALRR